MKFTGKIYIPAIDESSKIPPTCWCGSPMKKIGIGQYPYDCEAKDKYPNHMVYCGCRNKHTGWTHREE